MNPRNSYTATIATMRCHKPYSQKCTELVSSILTQQDLGNIIPFLQNKSDRNKLIFFLQQCSLLLLYSLPDLLVNGSVDQAMKQAHAIEAIKAIIDHYGH